MRGGCDLTQRDDGGGDHVQRHDRVDSSGENRFFRHPENDAAGFILGDGVAAGLRLSIRRPRAPSFPMPVRMAAIERPGKCSAAERNSNRPKAGSCFPADRR